MIPAKSEFLKIFFSEGFLIRCFLLSSFDHNSIRRSGSRDELIEENSNNFPDYYVECKKEASTTPNPLRNNNNNNSTNNNNESNSSSTHLLELKSEPMCNPSSPESSSIDVPPSTGLEDCAGCGRLIQVSKLLVYENLNQKRAINCSID